MTKPAHPYTGLPPERLWRLGMAKTPPEEVDPAVGFDCRIGPEDKVVAAGSCFAQHIARRLQAAGFKFLVTEPAHPILPEAIAQRFNYGVYSARYGNIYTARQLLQLLRRAYGRFTPADDVWEEGGRFFDPFRPQIQPDGFASRREYDLDRAQHLAAVRAAFEQADVFVFTLGLTECWLSRADGAAYTVCPGTAVGTYDPERHVFANFGVDEVVQDMTDFLTELRRVNPGVRTILTVSPVPLAATAMERHVLQSTTYSKAVLRVAAEALSARYEDVHYFPSYEVITGPFSRGQYFAEDLRQVTEAGVDHVMRLFFRHATEGQPLPESAKPQTDPFLLASKAAVDAMCDEDRLDDGL